MHSQTLVLTISLTRFSDSTRSTVLKTLLRLLQESRTPRRAIGTLRHYLDDIPPPLRQKSFSASHAIPLIMRTETAHIDMKLKNMPFDSAINLKVAALALVLADLDLPKNVPLTIVGMNDPRAVVDMMISGIAPSLCILTRVLGHDQRLRKRKKHMSQMNKQIVREICQQTLLLKNMLLLLKMMLVRSPQMNG